MALMVCLLVLLLTDGVSTGKKMKKGGGPVAGPSSGPVAGASSGPVAGASARAGAEANPIHPLDMAPNSVDDMYNGCEDQMFNYLPTYLENEKNQNSKFKKGWADAEDRANSDEKPIPGKEQKRALYYYTSGKDNKYKDFNGAVRSQGLQYQTTFKYHALHFLLTSAIKTLKAHSKSGCVTAYRRTGDYFQHKANTQFRFGSFASSSLGAYPDKRFGIKTCFEIITCMGADISGYSRFPEQKEVLIPPYEIFKVTAITKPEKGDPCEWVYKVESTKTSCSNFNCALIKESNLLQPCP